jgi:hypothetical protein
MSEDTDLAGTLWDAGPNDLKQRDPATWKSMLAATVKMKRPLVHFPKT